MIQNIHNYNNLNPVHDDFNNFKADNSSVSRDWWWISSDGFDVWFTFLLVYTCKYHVSECLPNDINVYKRPDTWLPPLLEGSLSAYWTPWDVFPLVNQVPL